MKGLSDKYDAWTDKPNCILSKPTYLTIFSSSNLAYNFIIFLVSPIHRECFIVPIIPRSVDINVGVYPAKSSEGACIADVIQ